MTEVIDISLRDRARFALLDEVNAEIAALTDAYYSLMRNVLRESDPPTPSPKIDGSEVVVEAEIDGLKLRVRRYNSTSVDRIDLEVRKLSSWYKIDGLAQLARLLSL